MVDEKQEHYEEDGEYHFSDDQVNYDVEPEPSTVTSSAPLGKEMLLEKFNQNRRKILGVVSVIVLIGVVYKILMPASTAPATEFTQPPAVTNTKKSETVTNTKSVTASQSVAPAVPPPVAQPVPVAENKPAPPAYAPQSSPPAVVATAPAAPASMPTHSAQPMVLPPAEVISPVPVSTMDTQTKDKIITLEQQNTAMMNLLQTEYAQKIADTETQVNAVRGKMEELTKRVNRMDTSLNQITQLLQGMSKAQSSGAMSSGASAMSNAPSRSAEPRMTYSVQAIIPGRAWLKSESGDTVTVAEGDYLKKYGRVTKIDPYDGVVAIDTGSKVITLSYGLDGE